MILRFVICSILAVTLACCSRHTEKVNYVESECDIAREFSQQASAADTAGDKIHSIKLSQQAIEAYELCNNATLDDQVAEVLEMTLVAEQFQIDRNLTATRSMYDNLFVKIATLCNQASKLSSVSHISLGFEIDSYREYGEPLGATSVDASCGKAFPRPPPSP